MDNINVLVNEQPDKYNPPKGFKRFLNPKIIFIILGLVILVEVVYAVKVFSFRSSSPSPSPLSQKEVVQQAAGKISLTATKNTFKVGEAVSIPIMINSGSYKLSGADVIIKFDPDILEAAPGAITKGQIFDEYPLFLVDTKNGLISISGVSGLEGGFKGTGQFASLNLKAKAKGNTFLMVDFQKGSTIDSNLVDADSSLDILEQVNNLELEIR